MPDKDSQNTTLLGQADTRTNHMVIKVLTHQRKSAMFFPSFLFNFII